MTDFLDFIKTVKSANDIVSVVGSYKQLEQRGQDFWTCCPFHAEKTPSFSVSRNKQIYKCFGCGESGDVIKFVEKIESCTFNEAVEILAKRANLEIPELQNVKTDKDLAERKKRRDIFYAILKETAKFYFREFYSPRGVFAREYIEKRGFQKETVKSFGLGLSPDMYSLPQHLEKLGYSLDLCKEIGVLQQTKNGRYFDALFGRLTVPIFDINKKVIAFGGRALSEENEKYGKYKNTTETPLFLKKDNLYAINFAKEQKQQAALPYVIVVEGYMDVIAMHEAGFRECVASMGTSLTQQQAKLISRLVSTVYICYDGDAAGQKATVRGLDILAEEGLELRVVSIPDGLDPDEFIRKEGADAFRLLLQEALPLIDYKLKILENYFDIKNTQKPEANANMTKYVKGAVELLKSLDEITRKSYLGLVSLKSGFSEDFLQREITKKTASKVSEDKKIATEISILSKLESALCFVANCILSGQPYAKIEAKPVCPSPFLNGVFNYIFESLKKGESPKADMIYTVIPNAEKEHYLLVCGYDFLDENKEKDKRYFDECLKIVEAEEFKHRRKLILDELVREGLSDERRRDLTAKLQKINQEINK